MEYLFHAVGLMWFASEVYLSKYLRSKSGDFQKDKHSLRYIWISVSIAVPVAVFSSKFISLPISSSAPFPFVGLAFILLGVLIRVLAIRKLGKFFTVNLAVDEQHTLVESGLYSLIRHPAYTGCLLSFVGLGLAFNNWISLAVLVLITSSAFLYRIYLEEKMLVGEMGEVYKRYQSRTKKIIPFIY